MEAHYSYAVKAGVFSGILLAVISILLYLTHFNLLDSRTLICNGYLCFLGGVLWLIMAGVGYQVVGRSRALIHSKTEAVAVSALAGCVAGLISGVAQFIITVIIPDVINLPNYGFSGHEAIIILTSLLGIVIIMIVTTFMSIVGGMIYLSRMVKSS